MGYGDPKFHGAMCEKCGKEWCAHIRLDGLLALVDSGLKYGDPVISQLAPGVTFEKHRNILVVDGIDVSLDWLKSFLNMPTGTLTRHDGRTANPNQVIFTDLTRQRDVTHLNTTQYAFDLANNGLRARTERYLAELRVFITRHKKWPYRFLDWCYRKLGK
jgi:hypothetical protein